MGLREKKATKTRKRIFNEALRLFKRDGFEQTTMEAIAEAAEVSPSTLYRYFESKDLILLDQMSGGADLAAAFARHAENLSAEAALAEAIFDQVRWMDSNREEILLLRSLIDQAPIARARLWDLVYQQERALSARLAEKLHLPEDDLRAALSARLVQSTIIGTVADLMRANDGSSSSIPFARRVMKLFEEQKVIFPRKAPN